MAGPSSSGCQETSTNSDRHPLFWWSHRPPVSRIPSQNSSGHPGHHPLTRYKATCFFEFKGYLKTPHPDARPGPGSRSAAQKTHEDKAFQVALGCWSADKDKKPFCNDRFVRHHIQILDFPNVSSRQLRLSTKPSVPALRAVRGGKNPFSPPVINRKPAYRYLSYRGYPVDVVLPVPIGGKGIGHVQLIKYSDGDACRRAATVCRLYGHLVVSGGGRLGHGIGYRRI